MYTLLRKILPFLASIMTVLCCASDEFADIQEQPSIENIHENEDRLEDFDLLESGVTPTQVISNGLAIYRITDTQLLEFFKQRSKVEYAEDEELIEVIFKVPPPIENSRKAFSPQFCSQYVKKVGPLRVTSGSTPIRMSSGREGTLTMSIQQSVQASYSVSVEIDVEKISAGVGFTVSKTYTVTDTTSIKCLPGYETKLLAYPVYHQQSFQVWDDPCLPLLNDKIIGTGNARKPIGVMFRVVRVKLK